MQKRALRVEYRWKIDKYKLELGCSKCGYNKCAGALHFHHIDRTTKDFEISMATSGSYSKEKLDKEINKCILVCANCHAEIEEEENNIKKIQ